jgi:hypothetical protein
MADRHLELIVKTRSSADAERLRERLHSGGLESMARKVGLLLAGSISTLRTVIPHLTGEEIDEVAVPDEWKNEVQAIHVVKPRSLL